MYWLLIVLFMGGCAYKTFFRTPPVEVLKFEQKYGLGTPTVPETDENIRDGRVAEVTPEGEVIMWREDEVFKYHAPRAVQFKYLETVARKYCIVFDCREIYVNVFRELLKNVPAETVPLDDVFVSLKPYNKRPKSIMKDNCNRYKWVGPKEKETVKLLSYADFKKVS